MKIDAYLIDIQDMGEEVQILIDLAAEAVRSEAADTDTTPMRALSAATRILRLMVEDLGTVRKITAEDGNG